MIVYREILEEGGFIEHLSIDTINPNNQYVIIEKKPVEEIFIPNEMPLWRIRVILRIMGLESNVEEVMELLEEPNKTAAKYIWEYGTIIERFSPTVLFIQSSLGLTDLQVDEIFIEANKINI